MARSPGEVFTTKDLLEQGLGSSRAAFDVALKRLVDQGLIARAGRGVFYRPEEHPAIGRLSPKPERVAEALARRSGSIVFPVGPDAANRLGLSTQVPARLVFFTSGRSSRHKIGNNTIELRHRVPRMADADPLVAQTIEALRSIGKETAGSREVVRRLREAFDGEEKHRIIEQLHFAPAWMWPILREIAS